MTAGPATFDRDDIGQYPSFDQLWPDPYQQSVTFSVDVDMLVKVAAALGQSELTVTVNTDNPLRPLIVTGYDGTGAAIVMPLKTPEE